jgi:uncharacterized membrane protein YeaQ/YmgE (transglycosylase-associated protein family)
MSFLAWIVLGGLAGWIASMFTRNAEEQGIVGNIVVGVLGALIGGWLVQAFGGSSITGFNLYSLLVSIVGAIVLLAVVNFFRRGSTQV